MNLDCGHGIFQNRKLLEFLVLLFVKQVILESMSFTTADTRFHRRIVYFLGQ